MRLGDLDALKEKVNAFYDSLFVGCVSSDLITYASGVDSIIDNAPTVVDDNFSLGYQFGVRQALNARPQGEWKSEGYFVFCDYCGSSNGNNKTPFCPYCGAEMKGGAE